MMTSELLHRLQSLAPVRFLSWSPEMQRRGLRMRFRRNLRILHSIVKLLANGRVQGQRLYIVANSKSGLHLTALVVQVGRRLGYQIFLHHHAYFYIDSYDWRMARIVRAMGARDVHVVHCDEMARDFAARYSVTGEFACVYPSIVRIPLGTPRLATNVPFRLGHLSNLSLDKGLDIVLKTFQAMRAKGLHVHLRLAGPFHTRQARRLVELAMSEHAGWIEYAGPVYGEEKLKYLQGIDCFLFPSRSESWGIVLHEALAVGAPVIAMRRGCARTVVGDEAGTIVSEEADFVACAVAQVERWIDEPEEYRRASQAAIDQAAHLHLEGERTLSEFAARLIRPQRSTATIAKSTLSHASPSRTPERPTL
jgi:glycosyltransferase involved in cell wall biosynthesis